MIGSERGRDGGVNDAPKSCLLCHTSGGESLVILFYIPGVFHVWSAREEGQSSGGRRSYTAVQERKRLHTELLGTACESG